MSTSSVKTKIVNGSNADRVIDALKYAFDKKHPHKIELVLQREVEHTGSVLRQKVYARVLGVEYESGTFGMFVLKVNMTAFGISGMFRLFYNANTREGYVIEKL